MRPCVVNLALGDRHRLLGPRLAESVERFGEAELLQWTEGLPPGAPEGQNLPWLAYCAKPFAMREAWRRGHTLLLWMDAACYAVGSFAPIWEHIQKHGAYCQQNGFKVGQWCSDAALGPLELTRDEAFEIEEISTCALGLDMGRPEARVFLREWCDLASDGITFPGAHTNDIGNAADVGLNYRGVGHVSDDPRVMGHRHDQTAASVLARRAGWPLTPRPIFVDYGEAKDPRTVIVNRG